ncbi:hypothetical protein PFDG_00703 [Plasmodium falciparum Dd2]|uniref:Rifin n=1 Tax=Plasmodium falciparum (isolate Dd2) TaxID=57267 RepID=A0A0L7LXD2_PLAF4|nr:hypothetical protein PFDG_00703 [Plasmodium falciparum Dd2]
MILIVLYKKANMVINTHKKPSIRPRHIQTTRLLCECELYAPSNYEYDQEMKEVLENFYRLTSERFREYDEKIQDIRKQCKEQCEKDMQKIILKDKIEKELTEKLGALQTDIRTEDIPTCVCEKSVADKTEKVCLNCGKTMGAVAPSWGLLSGLGYAGWSQYIPIAIAKASSDAGIKAAIKGVKGIWDLGELKGLDLTTVVTEATYNSDMGLAKALNALGSKICSFGGAAEDKIFCAYKISITKEDLFIKAILLETKKVAQTSAQAAANANNIASSNATIATSTLNYTIIASIVAIVVIVLVMVIIYLILRYRRKSKMKKKLQYIKLLKE